MCKLFLPLPFARHLLWIKTERLPKSHHTRSKILSWTLASQETLEGTKTDTEDSINPPSARQGRINVDKVFVGMAEV